MILYQDILQGSDEWDNLRKGVITASQLNKVITTTGKLSQSAAAVKYLRSKAFEIMTGSDLEDGFIGNDATDKGQYYETEAREWFVEQIYPNVKEVGFALRGQEVNGRTQPIGCSPDGLITARESDEIVAGLEIKCPKPGTHIDYLLNGELPSAYKLQVHGSMCITGLKAWYFLSYHPSPQIENLVLRVEWDAFTDQLDETLDLLVTEYAKHYAEVEAKAIVREEVAV